AIEAGTASIRQALGDTVGPAPAPVPSAPQSSHGFPVGALFVLALVVLSAAGGGLGRRRRRFGWGTPLLYGAALGGLGRSGSGFGFGGGSSGGFSGGFG